MRNRRRSSSNSVQDTFNKLFAITFIAMGFIVLLGMKSTSAAYVYNTEEGFSVVGVVNQAAQDLATLDDKFLAVSEQEPRANNLQTEGAGISLVPVQGEGSNEINTEKEKEEVSTKELEEANLLNKLPVNFEKNSGQLSDDEVKFFTRKDKSGVFFYDDKVKINLNNGEEQASIDFQFKDTEESTLLAEERALTKTNYFIGNDESRHVSDNPTFDKVTYDNLYKGVSATYYTTAQDLKYDINIQPYTTDPNKIEMQVSGANNIYINEAGNLTIETEAGEIYDQKLNVYQVIDGQTYYIPASFRVTSQTSYGFTIGQYNPDHLLTIDPLVYSTYLGGAGHDIVEQVEVDSSGNVYVAGTTTDSVTFTPAFTTTDFDLGDNTSLFVSKLNNDLSALEYTTFIGGSNTDNINDFYVNDLGQAYGVGYTWSADFPTTPGVVDTTLTGSTEGYVFSLDPTGQNLDYSTYIGGNSSDETHAIEVDALGNAYIVGNTWSNDLIATPGVIDNTFSGSSDYYLAKLNPTATGYDIFTFLTGNSGASAFETIDISLDSLGNIAFGFSTTADNLLQAPIEFATANPVFGDFDVYTAKLSPLADTLLYSGYLGGDGSEEYPKLIFNSADELIISGQTTSSNLPQTVGSLDEVSENDEGFISVISNKGSSILRSTYFGGADDDTIKSVALDSLDNIYIGGYTDSAADDMPITPISFQDERSLSRDGFVSKINPSLSSVDYFTFIGADNYESVNDLVIDTSGSPGSLILGGSIQLDFFNGPDEIDNFGVNGVQENFNILTDSFIARLNPVPIEELLAPELDIINNSSLDLVNPNLAAFPAINYGVVVIDSLNNLYKVDPLSNDLVLCVDQVNCTDVNEFNAVSFDMTIQNLTNLYFDNPSYSFFFKSYNGGLYPVYQSDQTSVVPEYIRFTDSNYDPEVTYHTVDLGDTLYLEAKSLDKIDGNDGTTIDVVITSTLGDLETVTLIEDLDTGIFRGSINSDGGTFTVGNGTFEGEDNDDINMDYSETAGVFNVVDDFESYADLTAFNNEWFSNSPAGTTLSLEDFGGEQDQSIKTDWLGPGSVTFEKTIPVTDITGQKVYIDMYVENKEVLDYLSMGLVNDTGKGILTGYAPIWNLSTSSGEVQNNNYVTLEFEPSEFLTPGKGGLPGPPINPTIVSGVTVNAYLNTANNNVFAFDNIKFGLQQSFSLSGQATAAYTPPPVDNGSSSSGGSDGVFVYSDDDTSDDDSEAIEEEVVEEQEIEEVVEEEQTEEPEEDVLEEREEEELPPDLEEDTIPEYDWSPPPCTRGVDCPGDTPPALPPQQCEGEECDDMANPIQDLIIPEDDDRETPPLPEDDNTGDYKDDVITFLSDSPSLGSGSMKDGLFMMTIPKTDRNSDPDKNGCATYIDNWYQLDKIPPDVPEGISTCDWHEIYQEKSLEEEGLTVNGGKFKTSEVLITGGVFKEHRGVDKSQVTLSLIDEDNFTIDLGLAITGANGVYNLYSNKELKDGEYTLVATTKGSSGQDMTAISKLTIDSTIELELNLENFSGIAFENNVPVKFDPGSILNIGRNAFAYGSTDVDTKVNAYFNSIVLTSIVMSDSSKGTFYVEPRSNLEPEVEHTLYLVAESTKDPNVKSAPIIIKFKMSRGVPMWMIILALISLLLVILFIIHRYLKFRAVKKSREKIDLGLNTLSTSQYSGGLVVSLILVVLSFASPSSAYYQADDIHFSILDTINAASEKVQSTALSPPLQTEGAGISLVPVQGEGSDEINTEEKKEEVSTKELEEANLLNKLPVNFEKNSGQLSDDEVKFFTRKDKSGVFFYDDKVKINLNNGEEQASIEFQFKDVEGSTLLAEERALTKTNYFIGNDESRHVSDNPTFDKVTYDNLYKGVSATYYTTAQDLKYDINIQPYTTDPNKIEMQVSGANNIYINEAGDLTIETEAGEIYDQKLNVYQVIDGQTYYIPASFRVTSQTSYGFTIGQYNPDHLLTIDPLVYSTYLGGSQYEEIAGIEIDADGNIYVAGTVYGSHADFPAPSAGSTTDFGPVAGTDVFVTKINSDFSDILYTTFIGGSGADSLSYRSTSFAIDNSGNAYLGGETTSNDYYTEGELPMFNAANSKGFLTKIDASGSDIIYSTYLGGEFVNDVEVDSSGNAYAAVYTRDSFAPVGPAIDNNFNGTFDIYLAKLSDDGINANLDYLSYVTGDNDTFYPNAIHFDLDNNNNIYLSLDVWDTSVPFVSPVDFDEVSGNPGTSDDIYVLKFNTSSALPSFSGLFGGGDEDRPTDIKVNSLNEAVITGYTRSDAVNFPGIFPITQGVFDQTFGAGAGLKSEGFVTVLEANGSGIKYSSLVGGNDSEDDLSLVTDSLNNIYIFGETRSVSEFPSTLPALQPSNGGAYDNFILKLNSTLDTVDYFSYLGGVDWEFQGVIALDKSELEDHVVVAGNTSALTTSTTPNVFQPNIGGSGDGYLVKIITTPAFLVNSNLDDIDASIEDGICETATGVCTLRAAIQESVHSGGVLEPIWFLDSYTINLATGLPSIDSSVFVDGTSSPSYSGDSLVHLLGPGGDVAFLLTESTSGSIIQGIEITNFNRAIRTTTPAGFLGGGVSINNNKIHGNLDTGIDISGQFTAEISQNSIYDNGNLGIDLSSYVEQGFDPMWGPVLIFHDFAGSTWNDAGDLDIGPNTLQNFPYIIDVNYDLNLDETTIEGYLESSEDETYTLEFFANSDPGDASLGEGETYLGDTIVNIPLASTSVPFSFTVSGDYSNSYLTSTATNSNGQTSEFGGNYNSQYEQITYKNKPSINLVSDTALLLEATLDPNYDYTFIFDNQVDGFKYYLDSLTFDLVLCVDQVNCLDASRVNAVNFSETATGLVDLFSENPSYILSMNRYVSYSEYPQALGSQQMIIPDYLHFTTDNNISINPLNTVNFGDTLYIQARQGHLEANGPGETLEVQITTDSGDTENIILNEVADDGIFTASIPSSGIGLTPANNIVEGADGDNIQLSFVDNASIEDDFTAYLDTADMQTVWTDNMSWGFDIQTDLVDQGGSESNTITTTLNDDPFNPVGGFVDYSRDFAPTLDFATQAFRANVKVINLANLQNLDIYLEDSLGGSVSYDILDQLKEGEFIETNINQSDFVGAVDWSDIQTFGYTSNFISDAVVSLDNFAYGDNINLNRTTTALGLYAAPAGGGDSGSSSGGSSGVFIPTSDQDDSDESASDNEESTPLEEESEVIPAEANDDLPTEEEQTPNEEQDTEETTYTPPACTPSLNCPGDNVEPNDTTEDLCEGDECQTEGQGDEEDSNEEQEKEESGSGFDTYVPVGGNNPIGGSHLESSDKLHGSADSESILKTDRNTDEDGNGCANYIDTWYGLNGDKFSTGDISSCDWHEIFQAADVSQEGIAVNGGKYKTSEILFTGGVYKNLTGVDSAVVELSVVDGDNFTISLGSVQTGTNGVFNFLNGTELKKGEYTLVATTTSSNGQKITATDKLIIDPDINISIDLKNFSGVSFENNQPSQSNLDGILKVGNRTFAFGSTGLDTKVTGYFNSVVLTSVVMSDSTKGSFYLEPREELESNIEHTFYLVAESTKDLEVKSAPIIVKFRINRGIPLWQIILICLLILLIAYLIYKKLNKNASVKGINVIPPLQLL